MDHNQDAPKFSNIGRIKRVGAAVYKKMASQVHTAIIRLVVFLLWCFLTAWLFVLVEHTESDELEEKKELLWSLYYTMSSKYNINIEDFNNFTSLAHKALSSPKPQWNYWAAVDFVFQAVTTVGYGFITPQTPAGQLLCIFVTLLGIPITMLAFKSVGELISKWTSSLVTKFEQKILHRPHPLQVQLKCAVILFALMVATIMLGGGGQVLEGRMNFLQGVYCWYITFTTIGFGDFVPYDTGTENTIMPLKLNGTQSTNSEDESPSVEGGTFLVAMHLIATVYFVLGLCVVASVLNSIMSAIEEQKVRPPFPKCISRRRKVITENEQQEEAAARPERFDASYLTLTPRTVVGRKNMGSSTITDLES